MVHLFINRVHLFNIDPIPALKVGIEYDGEAWHKSGRKDINKDLLCFANGVVLIRIREPNCPRISGAGPCYTLTGKKADSLNQAIRFIYDYLQDEYCITIYNNDIDVEANRIKIYELMELAEKEGSLGAKWPQIAEEWNYRKNASLTPEMVYEKSNKKVWWHCNECGHEWEAIIASRVAGRGCPVCGKMKAALSRSTPEYRESLQFNYPDLCKEWDYDRNVDLIPEQVYPNSHKKVWWKCSVCGEAYERGIHNQVKAKRCPVCKGKLPYNN